MAFVAASILPFSSCSDFLDREPITKPEAGNFLTGACLLYTSDAADE